VQPGTTAAGRSPIASCWLRAEELAAPRGQGLPLPSSWDQSSCGESVSSPPSRCTSGAQGDGAGVAEWWELLASDTHLTSPWCSGGPIPGNIHGQVGRGSEQPDVFEDVTAHCREVGLDDL